jgi:uncharacterized repeat protein (TIGR01451 family)
MVDPDLANNRATARTPLAANLTVVVDDGLASAPRGSTIVVAIRATNRGPSRVARAPLTATAPPGLTEVAWSCVAGTGGACGASGGTSEDFATTVDLAAGATATVELTGIVGQLAFAPLTTTATIAIPPGMVDPTPTNNRDSHTISTTPPSADLAVTMTGPATAPSGSRITYLVTVRNRGPSLVAGARLTDLVPRTAVADVRWTCAIVAGTGRCGATSGEGNLIIGHLDLSGDGVATYTISGRLDARQNDSIVNEATVAPNAGAGDPDLANNRASIHTVAEQPMADLSIALKAPERAEPGGALAYTLTVRNTGPSAANGAMVTAQLPTALLGVRWTCQITSGMGRCDQPFGVGAPNASRLTLEADAAATVVIRAIVSRDVRVDIVGAASVRPPFGVTDPDETNNGATVRTIVAEAADLQMGLTGPRVANRGASITYVANVTNRGPATVIGAQVQASLPAGLAGVTWTCAAASGGSCATASGSGSPSVKLNLPPGATAQIHISVRVPSQSGALAVSASVEAPVGVIDPAMFNNRDQFVTTVI